MKKNNLLLWVAIGTALVLLLNNNKAETIAPITEIEPGGDEPGKESKPAPLPPTPVKGEEIVIKPDIDLSQFKEKTPVIYEQQEIAVRSTDHGGFTPAFTSEMN